MNKRALLINPPIYDVQYWAEWSQPQGLLKVGSFLKEHGYETRLIDCLFPDAKRNVPKKTKSIVTLCSKDEIPYSDYRKNQNHLVPSQRFKFVFGVNLDDFKQELLSMGKIVKVASGDSQHIRKPELFGETPEFYPDEVWITSIMTYWWESTVDVAALCKAIFPTARIRVGGIYPTLASEHLRDKLSQLGLAFAIEFGHQLDLDDKRDLIVKGEIPEASWCDLDFELYYQPTIPNSRYYHGPGPNAPDHEKAIIDRRYYGPPYAILTTTRGCPFNCAYCAQHAYNLYDDELVSKALWTDKQGRKQTVRTRSTDDVLREIRDKFHRYGVRQYAFYEDNFLARKKHFRSILQGIVDDPDLRGNIHLHAPEGIEVRLIDSDLAHLMHEAGFERVYLPLENINSEVIQSWNRSHSNVQMFDRAVQNYLDAGFVLRNMQINVFLLFGTPGEKIRDVVDSIVFASKRTGSVIPMLFTPVPGSALYQEYYEYLHTEMGFDLQHLNGKLFPFWKFNQRMKSRLDFTGLLRFGSLDVSHKCPSSARNI